MFGVRLVVACAVTFAGTFVPRDAREQLALPVSATGANRLRPPVNHAALEYGSNQYLSIFFSAA